MQVSRRKKASTQFTSCRGSFHGSEWNDLRRGVSVNADIIEGGTRANVIAEHARAVLDLRALRVTDMARIEASSARSVRFFLAPALKSPAASIAHRSNEKSSAALLAKAKTLAAQMGLTLGECAAGGGSDGNLTAARASLLSMASELSATVRTLHTSTSSFNTMPPALRCSRLCWLLRDLYG